VTNEKLSAKENIKSQNQLSVKCEAYKNPYADSEFQFQKYNFYNLHGEIL